MHPLTILVMAVGGAAAASTAGAQDFNFGRDCAKWIEQKGYSRDYIELKVGQRQPGWPETWIGNVAPKDIAPGDVILSRVPNKGKTTRVAYVESVRRNDDGSAAMVNVTEWNFGKYTDESCFVTDHFGRLSDSKPISVSTIVAVWRPSLPLPIAAPR